MFIGVVPPFSSLLIRLTLQKGWKP
jgi:hypothetical protein